MRWGRTVRENNLLRFLRRHDRCIFFSFFINGSKTQGSSSPARTNKIKIALLFLGAVVLLGGGATDARWKDKFAKSPYAT